MRFLLDEQLSPVIVRWLRSKGFQADHVAEHGLLAMADADVVAKAVELDAIIVSKDADYLAWPDGLPVPLVSIRVGNVGNARLILTLDEQWDGVIERLRNGERIVLVF